MQDLMNVSAGTFTPQIVTASAKSCTGEPGILCRETSSDKGSFTVFLQERFTTYSSRDDSGLSQRLCASIEPVSTKLRSVPAGTLWKTVTKAIR